MGTEIMRLINIQLQLHNPFNWELFKSFGCISGRLSKHKYWELEHNFYGGMLLDIDFHIAIQEDHPDISLAIGLFGYSIHFHIYDHRHWDYETRSFIS
jgi:hypothetical protein